MTTQNDNPPTPDTSTKGGDISDSSSSACSTSYLHPLFNHMAQDHGLTLTESEMHDIMNVCEQLSEDKARLDWVERYKGRCGYAEKTYLGEGFFCHPHAMGDKYDAGKTIREAIDEARKIF